jgi:hypothetical protein
MVIIIVLKPDSSVNLGQVSGHRFNGQHELTQINIRIKIIIIIVLKPNSGVNQGKARVMGREGQLKLTQVNAWIKVVIIIILKLDLEFDLRQGSDHGSGESTLFTHIFY